MGIKREIYQLVVVGLSIWVVLSVTIQNYRVSGISMDPYLSAGDYLIVDKFNYLYLEGDILDRIIPFKGIFDDTQYSFEMNAPKRGDIVVFKDKFDSKYKIKYIFAEFNDWVDTSSVPPKIWIDNNNKNYLNKLTKLEHNTFYVLGYNEQMSKDSRHFGPISYDQIIGKLIFRYYPFNSIRFF